MTKDKWGKLSIDMNVVLCNGHERCNLIGSGGGGHFGSGGVRI